MPDEPIPAIPIPVEPRPLPKRPDLYCVAYLLNEQSRALKGDWDVYGSVNKESGEIFQRMYPGSVLFLLPGDDKHEGGA